jgi:hypothetical protein
MDAGREGATHRARLVRRDARRGLDVLHGGDAGRGDRRPLAAALIRIGAILRSFPQAGIQAFALHRVPAFRLRAVRFGGLEPAVA